MLTDKGRRCSGRYQIYCPYSDNLPNQPTWDGRQKTIQQKLHPQTKTVDPLALDRTRRSKASAADWSWQQYMLQSNKLKMTSESWQWGWFWNSNPVYFARNFLAALPGCQSSTYLPTYLGRSWIHLRKRYTSLWNLQQVPGISHSFLVAVQGVLFSLSLQPLLWRYAL